MKIKKTYEDAECVVYFFKHATQKQLYGKIATLYDRFKKVKTTYFDNCDDVNNLMGCLDCYE